MNALLSKVIDAHGGIDRWEHYTKVEASIVSGGGLFALSLLFFALGRFVRTSRGRSVIAHLALAGAWIVRVST